MSALTGFQWRLFDAVEVHRCVMVEDQQGEPYFETDDEFDYTKKHNPDLYVVWSVNLHYRPTCGQGIINVCDCGSPDMAEEVAKLCQSRILSEMATSDVGLYLYGFEPPTGGER